MVRKGLVELSKLAEGRTEANESALKRLVLRDASLRDAELICLSERRARSIRGSLFPGSRLGALSFVPIVYVPRRSYPRNITVGLGCFRREIGLDNSGVVTGPNR